MSDPNHDVSDLVRVALPIPLHKLFDYRKPTQIPPEGLKIGMRLRVPFGKQYKIGVLIEFPTTTTVPASKLKTVAAVLDDQPLLAELDLRLLLWASRYYFHPLGEVLSAAFPVALRKGNPAALPTTLYYRLTATGKNIDSAKLGRAQQQRRLLDYLQQQPEDWHSETTLMLEAKSPKAILKALLEKQLVVTEERTEHYTNFANPTLPAILAANPEQQHAIDTIGKALNQFNVFLLDGVTGSGKTEVYMQIIQQVIDAGQQVLVLLPEISLTPQTQARFLARFQVPIAISHSKLTDNQRQVAWLHMQQGHCSILLGTRSALFTPLKTPGLIILDEEHDSSFKQQEGFRFSARDVAIMRAKFLNIPVILGSATPSFESLDNAYRQRYQHLVLPNRAGIAIKPQFTILDIRNKPLQDGFSAPLLDAIKATLAKQEQVLIFINRRGFAPVLICDSCGWVARCKCCDTNLVTHFDEKALRCHHCGFEQRLPQQCPACKQSKLTALGLGTERIEKTLHNLFANYRIVRLDHDTTQRKGSLADYLSQINAGQVDIVLGTQMLAKGHHFPKVTLVALLDVDSGLFSIDFRSPEKLAQLIVQVAGRAGRAEKPGKVILQTRHPEHPLLQTLIHAGYAQLAQSALLERKQASLPPFSYQALLRADANSPQIAITFLQTIAAHCMAIKIADVNILGPVSAPMLKRAGQYRYQLLLQATQRAALHGLLDQLMPALTSLRVPPKLKWSLDIDPADLY